VLPVEALLLTRFTGQGPGTGRRSEDPAAGVCVGRLVPGRAPWWI